MILVLVIVAIVGVALVIGIVLRDRTSNDGVDSFRRQIDALSSEARKPTVEQVKRVDDEVAGDDDIPGDGDSSR